MSRDYRKLRVFVLADDLVIQIYQASKDFPVAERFGLQSQIRRAAVSVPTNIVEGSARRSLAEYLSFVNIAAGSAAEVRYLVDLCHRLGFLGSSHCVSLTADYTQLAAALEALMQRLSAVSQSSRRSNAKDAVSPEP
jgi:four helix bundle protein